MFRGDHLGFDNLLGDSSLKTDSTSFRSQWLPVAVHLKVRHSEISHIYFGTNTVEKITGESLCYIEITQSYNRHTIFETLPCNYLHFFSCSCAKITWQRKAKGIRAYFYSQFTGKSRYHELHPQLGSRYQWLHAAIQFPFSIHTSQDLSLGPSIVDRVIQFQLLHPK